MAEIKAEMEKSPNSPPLRERRTEKKIQAGYHYGDPDRPFHQFGRQPGLSWGNQKVYGPFTIQGQKFLVQILARLPNTFYKISQIFIDTSVFRYRIADSIGKSIVSRARNHQDSFEHLAQTYSMGGEAATQGDLGWVAKGSILPAIDKQLAKSKKGDVFMIWSDNGVHIIKLTDGPKQDNGVALMMRVFL